jgi:hypothetical protein
MLLTRLLSVAHHRQYYYMLKMTVHNTIHNTSSYADKDDENSPCNNIISQVRDI